MTTWDRAQRAVLGDEAPTVLVLGGPGTGRTSLCLERVARHVESGGELSRVVVVAHSRSAAQALRTALTRRVGGAHLDPLVTTVHALARRIVAMGGGAPRLLTAPEQEFRIRDLLDATDTTSWPEELREGARTAQFASDVRVLAARLRQEGRDPADLVADGRRYGVESWEVLGGFLADYLDVLDLEGTIDYAEAVHRARILLSGRAVGPDGGPLGEQRIAAAVRARTDLLVCDDLTECDPSQVRLLARIAACGVPAFLTADPDQTVYGFRGASTRGLDVLVEEFPSPSIHHLTTNHRSSRAVAEVVETIRTSMPAVPADPAMRRRPDACASERDGAVERLTAASPTTLYRNLADGLRRAHLAEGVEWRDMSVVTRHGADLGVLSTILVTEGIPVRRSRDEHALADVHSVGQILLGLDVAAGLAQGREPDAGTVSALIAGPLAGVGQATRHRLEEWAERVGTEIDWHLLHGLADGESSLVEDGEVVGLDPGEGSEEPGPEDGLDRDRPDRNGSGQDGESAREEQEPVMTPGLRRAVEPLAAMTVGLRRCARVLAAGGGVHEALWALWNRTAWSSSLRRRALGGDVTADRELDGLCSLFDLAESSPGLVGVAGAERLVSTVRSERIPADRARESDEDRQKVSVVTAHRVKGRQFRVVAVCGLEEGNWPAPNHTGSLVDADIWSPEGPVPAPGWAENLAAEERLFLVACSRASERLVLCSVDDPESGVVPSSLLTRVEADETAGGRMRHTTLTELVGELRRTAADTGVSPALRARAARVLLDLAGEVDGDGHALVPQADPVGWWCNGAATGDDGSRPVPNGAAGTSTGAAITSPEDVEGPGTVSGAETVSITASHVGELLTCPRRWFMTRRAGAEGSGAVRTTVGTLIHRVAAENMADWSLERAREELQAQWSTITFPASWQASEELEAARDSLGRLDRWLTERDRDLVGTEVGFDAVLDLPGGPVHLRGSIDRLERDGEGACYVVDLKTGRSTSPLVQDFHALQIGVYQAVVAAGGVPELGPVRVSGAELVHVRIGAGRGGALPKVVRQAGLAEQPWPDDAPGSAGGEDPAAPDVDNWVLAAVDRAAGIVRGGRFPAILNDGCAHCPARAGCPALVPSDPAVAPSGRQTGSDAVGERAPDARMGDVTGAQGCAGADACGERRGAR